MPLRTIVLNHHSLSQPWEILGSKHRGAFYVAKASVKLVIFLPCMLVFATSGCIPLLTWWPGGWRKSRNESFCFCVFPVLRGTGLYCLCAYHSLCYTWTLWSPWPWTDGWSLHRSIWQEFAISIVHNVTHLYFFSLLNVPHVFLLKSRVWVLCSTL